MTLNKEALSVEIHSYKVHSSKLVSSRDYSVTTSYQTLCQTDIFIKLRATLRYKKEKPPAHTGPHRLVFPAETLKEMREQPVISGQNAQKVKACAGQELGTQLQLARAMRLSMITE